MRSVQLAVGVGLTLTALLLALTLTHSPISVARVNVSQEEAIGNPHRKTEACQGNEVLPAGTSAIRLRMFSGIGPRVAVKVLAGGRVITSGRRGSGWTGGVVTVPVHALARSRSGVTLCFTLLLNGNETTYVAGQPTTKALAAHGYGQIYTGRFKAEYLKAGSSSWWSLLPTVVRHMGFGHAWGGIGGVIVVLLLMSGVIALSSRLLIRELR